MVDDVPFYFYFRFPRKCITHPELNPGSSLPPPRRVAAASPKSQKSGNDRGRWGETCDGAASIEFSEAVRTVDVGRDTGNHHDSAQHCCVMGFRACCSSRIPHKTPRRKGPTLRHSNCGVHLLKAGVFACFRRSHRIGTAKEHSTDL